MNTRQELKLAREAMLRQMAETEAELKKYEKFPDDNYPTGTVLRFNRTISVVKKDARVSASVKYVEIMGGEYATEPRSRTRRRTGETNTEFQLRRAQEAHAAAFALRPGDNAIVQINTADFPEAVREDKEIVYAALKAGDGEWYLTGAQSPRASMPWDGLVELLLDWNVKAYDVLDGTGNTVELA